MSSEKRFFEFVRVANCDSGKLKVSLMLDLQVDCQGVSVYVESHGGYLIDETETTENERDEPEDFPVEVSRHDHFRYSMSSAV